MKARLLLPATHTATITIAVSYLTFGVLDSHVAGTLWAPYAVVMLALALVNCWLYGRLHGGDG